MLGDGVEEFSIVPVVYPCGMVVSHHLVIFCLLVLLLKLFILLCLSLSDHATFKIISRIRGIGKKTIQPQQEKTRHEERTKQRNVIVRAKLVAGYWDFINMESGS